MLTVNAERSETPVAAPPHRWAPAATTVSDEPNLTFEQIVEQQQAHVARRLLGWSIAKNDVDDVVQDVFLAVLKGLPKFRGQSSVSTWVTRITINGCRAHRRKRIVRRAVYERWIRQAPAPPDPEPPANERDETHRRVRQAVGSLPNRYREVVVLRYLQGMEVDEMIQVLSLTRGAIEVRLHRVRVMVTRTLELSWVSGLPEEMGGQGLLASFETIAVAAARAYGDGDVDGAIAAFTRHDPASVRRTVEVPLSPSTTLLIEILPGREEDKAASRRVSRYRLGL